MVDVTALEVRIFLCFCKRFGSELALLFSKFFLLTRGRMILSSFWFEVADALVFVGIEFTAEFLETEVEWRLFKLSGEFWSGFF